MNEASCRLRNPAPKVSEKQLNHSQSYVQVPDNNSCRCLIWMEPIKHFIWRQQGMMLLTSTFSSQCQQGADCYCKVYKWLPN